PDDDVLLQADQLVLRPAHGGVGEHPRRLLEGGRAHEGLGGQARLRDAEQQRLGPGGRATPGDHLLVRLPELRAVHVLALEVVRVARVRDPDLLEHLPDDHTDVLVVDLHALQAVDLLHLVQQVLLHGPRTLDPQDVVRVDRTFREPVAGPDLVTLVHPQVLADRDLVDPLRPLRRNDDDLALAALDLTEPDRPVDLRDDGRILGPPGFEELGHPRETAGDVPGLVDLAGDLGQRRAGLHDVAISHRVLRAVRDDELPEPLLAGRRPDLDHRVELLVPILRDDELAPARGLVERLADGLVLDDVDELDLARVVRHDRLRVRIPAEQQVAGFHVLAVLDGEGRAVRHGQPAAHRALGREHHDLALAAGHDPLTGRRLHERDPVEHRLAVDLRLALRLRGDARRGPTDVERPQRELRARLTDRLRRQDAHRLADVHHLHGGQVAAVAHPAEPALRLARQHGPDLDRLDARRLDGLGHLLVDHLPGPNDQFAVDRVVDIIERDVADDPVLQRLDDVFAFLERRHLDAQDRPAVLLGDRDVLRHVHEAAGEVAGIRRLQRRVRQTLPRAVRRDEVLEHGESFAEVRLDRALDDLADAPGQLLLRLGHEAAHPGELTHLVTVTARARVHHHVDGVEPVVRALEPAHHGVRHVVVGMRPGVDHLVVTLAVGDHAVLVGAGVPRDLRLRLGQDLALLLRDHQVHQADRDPTQGRVAEAEVLERVQELRRAAQPHLPVCLEDDVAQLLLPHGLVPEAELLRNDGVEDHAPDGRLL